MERKKEKVKRGNKEGAASPEDKTRSFRHNEKLCRSEGLRLAG